MGTTIIGPSTTTGPRAEAAVIVETKETWSDSWSLALDLEAVRATVQVGSRGAGTCQLAYRYGRAKSEEATTFVTRIPHQYVGRWVRLRLGGDQGLQTIWQGRILSEVREVLGSSWGPTGIQRFIAYDGSHVLERLVLSTSWWDVSGLAEQLEWMPSVNLQDRGHPMTGNRNDTKINGSYLFGRGSSAYQTWTLYEFLEYLIAQELNGSGRPTWTITGATEALKARTSHIPLPAAVSVKDIVRKLIDPSLGLDWVVLPTTGGFTIKVFSLSWVGAQFGGYELPSNSNWVRVAQATDPDVAECVIERSDQQSFDRIRVTGERAKTVVTIPHAAKWPASLETASMDGTGTPADLDEEHDAARKDDRLRIVWSQFAALESWSPSDSNAQPILTTDGSLSSNQAPGQQVVRRTLPNLLLREGWDYTTDPPTEPSYTADYDTEESFLPALVLAKLVDPNDPTTLFWLPVDQLADVANTIGLGTTNIGVSVLGSDWGVLLNASPRHTLAKGRWSGANGSDFDPDTDGGIDYDDLYVTITIEGDYRLSLSYALPSALQLGDGSEMVIECPGAEYWYLAPSTVLGVDAIGALRQSPATGVELRNDIDKLHRIMAGAIARYAATRYSCRLKYRRLENWGNLTGQILMLVETGSDATQGYVGAPITSVAWHFGQRTSEIRSEYAL